MGRRNAAILDRVIFHRSLATVLVTGAILPSATLAATSAPNTTIKSGPAAHTTSRSATFRFVASVRGASFQCKLDRAVWSQCSSPKRFSQLKEGRHVFRVRARKNGAMDPSPATRIFTVDPVGNGTAAPGGSTGATGEPGTPTQTSPPEPPPPEVPITKTQETAEEAAELYFPDTINLDVPASCGGSTPVDCPGGNPLPPEDQLSVTSTRSVVEQVGQSRYDVTAVSGVATLKVIKASLPIVGECDVTLTSANGTFPNWTTEVPLNFVKDPTSGDYRIEMGNLTLNGFEASDYSLSSTTNIGCQIANPGTSFFQEIYLTTLHAHFDEVGEPMCAAPGPAYLGPCPP
jgi:hypothetical protein